MSSAARSRLGGWALVLLGALLVADGVLMAVWQEPLGALRQAHAQSSLERELAAKERLWPLALPPKLTPVPGLAPLPSSTGVRAQVGRYGRALDRGEAVGRLLIPKLGVDEVVVEGADEEVLRRGPGRYPQTRLPGQGGTVGIAAHRTTYGAPLRHADRLRAGDWIVLRMPYGTYGYEVTGTRIVAPEDVEVLRSRGGAERLVLTTCHPLHTATQRLVVLARRA